MRQPGMSLESIAFQSTAFFDALTHHLESLRLDEETGGPKDFYDKSEKAGRLLEIIHDFTGLNVTWHEHPDNGPALFLPYFTVNHIFINEKARDSESMKLYIKDVLRNMNEPYFRGTIDLRQGRVTGDFCRLPAKLLMPYELLVKGTFLARSFPPNEVAAIILHEIGHAFTTIEYADRTMTTNQVLAAVSAARQTQEPQVLQRVYVQATKLMQLTPQQVKALESAQDENGTTVILAAIAMEKSRSELGQSVFDVSACEQLADQFAARHGAARALVLALDKIVGDNSRKFGRGLYWLGLARPVIFLALLSVYCAPLSLLLLLGSTLMQTKAYDTYGSYHTRISRLKHELVEQIKDRSLSQQDQAQILEAIQTLDTMLAQETNKLGFFETLAYYVKSSYRQAHQYEVLQRQLEALAHNNLFAQAAKFSLLSQPQ